MNEISIITAVAICVCGAFVTGSVAFVIKSLMNDIKQAETTAEKGMEFVRSEIFGLRKSLDAFRGEERRKDDELKAKACFEALDDTVDNAMEGLEQAFQLLGLNQWEGETDVFMELHGIELPYYFKPDFCNLIELKIRSPRLNPPRKDGSRTWSKGNIPKTPYGGWLNQVSVYNSYFGRQPVIVCANNVESKVYHPQNGDWMLEQDHLNNTMQNIVQDLKRHEHILRKSENLEELVQMVIPDWDHISWSSMNPEVLDEAKLLFGVI